MGLGGSLRGHLNHPCARRYDFDLESIPESQVCVHLYSKDGRSVIAQVIHVRYL